MTCIMCSYNTVIAFAHFIIFIKEDALKMTCIMCSYNTVIAFAHFIFFIKEDAFSKI